MIVIAVQWGKKKHFFVDEGGGRKRVVTCIDNRGTVRPIDKAMAKGKGKGEGISLSLSLKAMAKAMAKASHGTTTARWGALSLSYYGTS